MDEIVSKRKWDSKLFDTGRIDEKERPIYGTRLQNGLHDIEPDGSFVDIDPLFEGITDGDETDRVRRTRCGRISIGNKLDQSKDSVKILTKNGCGVRIKLKGYQTYGPHFDDLRSTYFTTNDGITLRYYPKYNGVKLVIVVDNPQVTSNVFRFRVKEIGCSYVYEEIDGGIKCVSSTGKDDIYIKSPYAVDANGDYGSVRIRLDGQDANGNQIFKKVVNPIWYGNAVGPVELDPDVTIDDDSGTLGDMFMSSFGGQIGNNYGATTIGAAHRNAANNQAVGWLKVDLSAFSNIIVSTAYWGLDIYTATGSPDIYGYECLRDIIEGTKAGTAAAAGEPTWNSYSHPTMWTTGGARGSGTDRAATADNNQVVPVNNDVHFTVSNSLAESWANVSNYGEFLDVPSIGMQALWRSSETGVGNKPYFFMEYTEGGDGIVFQSILVPKPSLTPLTIPATIPGGAEDNTWITN